ncbi:MAG TPA: ABC transporter permease, partial [Prevotella sp.]|nr:ABC transporter permease [Prevotella sp.]
HARRKVADIDSCEWYIFSRSYNPGYTGFGQDADRMANLASVLPIIFFLVAALVCLTTMTRMVEEQRVQIGALKALGYSRLAISWKYIGYGLLPSVTGGVLGLVIGYILFPKMIFTAYQIMYQMPDIELHAYTDISLFSVLAAVACTTVATLWACLATLRETPASLMRPRTPKAGKRVFLEYIRPLWKRMSFTYKVTARNLFRYQKRFWMTVIGIGGCTALIIAGFGMRSSLLFTMSRQYDELFHYSAQVTLSDNALPEERAAVEDFLASDSRIVNYIPCAASSATAMTSRYSTTAYVEVMESGEIGKAIDLFCADGFNIFPSKGEMRKLVKGGGVSLNKEKLTAFDQEITSEDLIDGKYLLLQKGKKNYFLITVK